MTGKVRLQAKDLLKLPVRKWNDTSIYTDLCLVNTRKKHDSGYGLMAVVGMNLCRPVEIAAFCDDVQWVMPPLMDANDFRTDMFFPSGIIHFHSNRYSFMVLESLSTTAIKLIKDKK